MKKAPLKKVLEKFSDLLIELGKALIIAGFASLFLKPVNWLYAIGGVTLGLILIGVGLFVTYYAETLGGENAQCFFGLIAGVRVWYGTFHLSHVPSSKTALLGKEAIDRGGYASCFYWNIVDLRLWRRALHLC
ncbi:hypothetical protein L0337_21895 [candidate division KSB1 bacterium]|nr:hypothetical protein [candidate division KSB1 bacterium]